MHCIIVYGFVVLVYTKSPISVFGVRWGLAPNKNDYLHDYWHVLSKYNNILTYIILFHISAVWSKLFHCCWNNRKRCTTSTYYKNFSLCKIVTAKNYYYLQIEYNHLINNDSIKCFRNSFLPLLWYIKIT